VREHLHPPYQLPWLRSLGAHTRNLEDTLHDIRVTRTVVNTATYLNMTATFFDHGYGPEGGITISLYWEPRDGRARPIPMLRIGDTSFPYPGPDDSLPGAALGLPGVGFNLSDVLPVSIGYLWELREHAEKCWQDSMKGASLYAVAKLNATAQHRSRHANHAPNE
jgi:hypothetical protein